MRVIFTDLDVDRDDCVKRLDGALRTLLATDPKRHRGVVRYIRQIAVWAGHYTAADDLGGIQLSSSHLMSVSDIQLASILVHEAVHLRIERLGVPYAAKFRERIERRCVEEQASFLRRIAVVGEELAHEAESALETDWWTAEAHSKDMDRLAGDFGLPSWLLPMLKAEKGL